MLPFFIWSFARKRSAKAVLTGSIGYLTGKQRTMAESSLTRSRAHSTHAVGNQINPIQPAGAEQVLQQCLGNAA